MQYGYSMYNNIMHVTYVHEQCRLTPNALYLANAKVFQKRAQLRGYLAEAEVDIERAASETKLIVLGEVGMYRLSVEGDGGLEDEQIVEKCRVELTK